jgi:methylthioribose-1-phosphate isomerase
MRYNGKSYRTVWFKDGTVYLVNQTLLPFQFQIHEARSSQETCAAIKDMIVRGAPAIGAAAGFAMAQAFLEAPERDQTFVARARKEIEDTRPTAHDLFHAVDRVCRKAADGNTPRTAALAEAQRITEENVESCRKIGEYGSELIDDGFKVMTHCNTGWLACVDYGTALSTIYTAREKGRKAFVYVSETRPRSQGGRLTAWELQNEDIPYCIFVDSAGAYVMQEKEIDMVIVGADRIARNGDVANKIGTLEKAIVAKELGIPLYVAAPTSTFDLNLETGKTIPIEHRSRLEVLHVTGMGDDNSLRTVLVYPKDFKVMNPAFDITPAKYITGIITEKGIIPPGEIAGLVSDTAG